MALVSVVNLEKSYESRTLFTDVSFSLERGEKYGLVGVNGAGKSTLCRIIIGNENADEGSVTMAKSTSVAYLTQFFTLRESLTVHEELVANFESLFELYERVMDAAHKLANDTTKESDYADAWEIGRASCRERV